MTVPNSVPPPGPVSAERGDPVVEKAVWQAVLTADRPRRRELSRLRCTWPRRRVAVRVHRNHPFELVTDVWEPFLAFADLAVEVETGAYDDTLAFGGPPAAADLEIVSLDHGRYAQPDPQRLASWCAERVGHLAERTTAPVLVGDWPSPAPRAQRFNELLRAALEPQRGVHVVAVDDVRRHLGADFEDERARDLTGTSWSGPAHLEIARRYGLDWIPAALADPVKAVVTDLDGTLYDGVLGEDGTHGVVLTPAHHALQRHLVALAERGVYVAVASRNEPADVERLFAERADFPLRPTHLARSEVGWHGKGESVQRVVDQLRIDPGAVVLLDDNIGELSSAARVLPRLRTLHAPDPASALRALRHCPGLFPLAPAAEVVARADDLAMNSRRDSLRAAASSPAEYLRSLDAVLSFRVDRVEDVPRLAELARRTNQFNTSLARTSERELERRLRDGSAHAVAVSLSDRLSDSGTVAFVLAHEEADRLVVEEVCVSCRALGRGLEDLLLRQALLLLAPPATTELHVRWVDGPRNAPALAWLDGFADRGAEAGHAVSAWVADDVRAVLDGSPVTLRTEE